MKLFNFSKSRLILILCIFVTFLNVISVTHAAEDTWTYKANMPTARVFTGGCVIDGKIYVISGAPSASSVTPVVEMYDPTADTWNRKANIPSARCYPATCAFDGKIYVFGGTSPSMWSLAKKNVFLYDPQTDSWTQKADMPYAIAGCGIAVVDGIIYLIGGSLSESSPPIQTVMAYDPVTESWAQKADMPTARGFFSACALDGKIYAIGGAKEDWSTNSYKHTEVYDPSTDTWTRKSDMPTKRWGLGTCVVDGKIFAIGGNSAYYASTTANEVYNPVTDTWITKSPMRQKRYGLVVASVGNKIYAIGGSVPGFLSTVEEYDTSFNITSLPPDFNGDEVVDINDLIILIEYWGTDEPLCDISPTPFGDGIVDIQDLTVLVEYMLEEIPPDEPEEVNVDEDDNGSRVELEQEQILVVTLDSNPTTGYLWEVVENQESILEQIGESEFKPSDESEPPMAGAGGWEIFRFKAIGTGETTLRLVYRRPWEEGVEPANTFSINVVVN